MVIYDNKQCRLGDVTLTIAIETILAIDFNTGFHLMSAFALICLLLLLY